MGNALASKIVTYTLKMSHQ